MFIVGLVLGKKYSEMIFLFFLLDLVINKDVNYFIYLIYFGGNCGCG